MFQTGQKQTAGHDIAYKLQ